MCVAEERNREELEKIRQQQEDSRKILSDLDRKHNELDQLVARAKQMKVSQESEVELIYLI